MHEGIVCHIGDMWGLLDINTTKHTSVIWADGKVRRVRRMERGAQPSMCLATLSRLPLCS